jgi:hypothetical protein
MTSGLKEVYKYLTQVYYTKKKQTVKLKRGCSKIK